MALNIVLIEPEIPNNTGNIGRLALATGSTLHLVKPFGFEISDSRLKRAGLDYWQHLDIHIYESSKQFFEIHRDKSFALFSSHGEKMHWDIDFEEELFLVFGKESVGLSSSLLDNFQDQIYKIPMYSQHIRSLNLANAVSIIIYEGLRQLKS
ncbi:tRNA (cytidine(34)-2'-O)-methyltransferase [Psychroserpens sp.]|uniref:tRNA (cytidine(34)-2'-O)-methyltransferase n=1 Tax=Psychroserpens sp. TaxID=2020870 RepID=UPI001B2420A6|nr:tRNA (cytidine(34)-2'-O)-methyltransferase [Psychroserpens sp.]MBO6606071.1 tRNA (cytidine(34)-2'-O)-methyltransferase [Psychroserpens sp.]MBO6631604.1 tRNA (cytidine(34)-2'-O)-methyltransferase [Psychroserpens sp.]MBO6652558.1 tRNA (cytidine(34)-2'-O)-methyltransferase [Psychroserpens sp.]MBO6681670.1 tRNA (cytidine(34)-2'-O)-methyltransferase [Psychroserpens sp.]MBO6749445.1 tRNA (cytidine(34)-2'-O)-methyltransferase [Psychroserpens sp.]